MEQCVEFQSKQGKGPREHFTCRKGELQQLRERNKSNYPPVMAGPVFSIAPRDPKYHVSYTVTGPI